LPFWSSSSPPIDYLRQFTGKTIEPAVMTPDDFHHALVQYPALDDSVEQLVREITSVAPAADSDGVERLRAVANEAPMVRLVNTIVLQAVRRGASDIHIEPQEHRMRIRYRIDGILYSVMTPPKHIQPALVSRLKIMGAMDIGERRVPQDGRAELTVDNRRIDIRMSTIPTAWGEKVVLRILEKQGPFVDVGKLGLTARDQLQFEPLVTKPFGILLLTGPTGSGKTTTQYAILNRLNRTEVNIVTVEDPIEYELPGIAQVQVNVKAGVTFANVLRSFLRHDPDIIMVGEIRDEETARIAIHAALTGHLVLSTLHTNDSVGAITRLVDMGIEPFLVASSMIGVIAQRLVRILCPRCKEPYTAAREIFARAGIGIGAQLPTMYRPKGCPFCNHIGYRGRTAIFEIMVMDDTIRGLVAKNATSNVLKEAAIAAGTQTLYQSGLAKVFDGTTSLEDVLRVVTIEDGRSPLSSPAEPRGEPSRGPLSHLAPRDGRDFGA